MNKSNYQGSCHCGRVKFEAAIDLSQGTTKCNCTSCWKRRWWSTRCATAEFRLLTGEAELVKDSALSTTGLGGFCKHCGVKTFAWVDQSEWNPETYVSINVACLDNLEPLELLAAPIQYCDGRAGNWWHPPAEVRHL